MTAAVGSVADIHDLRLGEEVERRGATLAVSESRVLDASERHLRLAAHRRGVHVEHAGFRLVGVAERGPEVVRVDRRREPVADTVRGRERGVEIARGDHAHDRAEDLLLRERHARVDVAEDRRLDEVAGTELRSRWLAAVSDDLRTGALAVVDLRLHFAKLGLVDDRAHPHALLEAIAGAPGLGLAGEELIELVEDRTQHDRAARRRAALPGGAERATRDGLGGLLEISVVHDDDRVLPAHLELDLAQAVERLCKVQLEMGGKNAVIVMDDADLEKAAESVAGGAFGATGQRCTATSRAVVLRSVLDEFNELLARKAETWRAGDGLEQGVRMGPIVDETQLRKVKAKIDDGKRSGAKVIRDGGEPTRAELRAGYFVEPTIFSDVDPRMPLAQEEIFGPVVSVISARDLDAALAAANGVGYGLSSAIYTNDLRTAFRYADESEAGMLHVNTPTVGGEPQVPFGGVKDSGFGDRECGTAAFDFFTEAKVVYVGY